METLTRQNDALIRRISEESQTTTIVREGIPKGEQERHSSHSDGRREEDEYPDHHWMEASDEDNYREVDPEKVCRRKEKKEKLRDVVDKL